MAYNEGPYYIQVSTITSLHLVKPLLLTGVEGLQSAFHLSQPQARALTLVSTVGDFLYWLLPISNTKTQMQYVLQFYVDVAREQWIYNNRPFLYEKEMTLCWDYRFSQPWVLGSQLFGKYTDTNVSDEPTASTCPLCLFYPIISIISQHNTTMQLHNTHISLTWIQKQKSMNLNSSGNSLSGHKPRRSIRNWHLLPQFPHLSHSVYCHTVRSVILLLLFLWQMVEKLSHHCSVIPVECDGVLQHLLVGIEFRAM